MLQSESFKLDAGVLGQLLLMQNVLCNLPNEDSILQFVCRGLADIPGVSGASHFATDDEGRPVRGVFPLRVGSVMRGEVRLNISDPAAYGPYEPYLRNFIAMVAVIMEERRQRRMVEDNQLRLEERVQERTRQLSGQIAERRAMEQELQRSRDLIIHTLDSVPQAIFWKDLEGRYLGCNQVYAASAGLKRAEDVIGLTDFDLPCRPGDADAYRKDDREVVETGRPKRHLIEQVQRADGSRLWVDTSKVPLMDQSGEVYGVVGVFEDITERLRAEAERARLQEQLNQAQKIESVGRLAGGVAHDFNNMLQAITGCADLALEQAVEMPALQENLREILKAAHRSAELTRQLLAFARKQPASPRVLDLNQTVEGIFKMLRRLIGENIKLIWQPASDLWRVKMDPVQIDQLLANLTVNGRDAINGAGQITIETANWRKGSDTGLDEPEVLPGDYVRLKISDTGCGMSKEMLEHLFEPFYTTKAAGQGTGLGLATVYGIVKQNGGYVSVQSEVGRGTVFTILMPRCVAEPSVPAAPMAADMVSGKETVLLVEDEEQILRLGQRVLQRLGYTVLTAQHPEDALRIAGEHEGSIDLLVTDVVMPGLNGRELFERLSKLRPGLGCLFVSGYTADVIARQGVIESGVQFLQKPFSIGDLGRKVRTVLDARHS